MVEMIWLKAKGKIDMMSVEENESDAGILAQIRARYRLSLEFERKGSISRAVRSGEGRFETIVV
jgi:hypothetical protein